VNISPANSSTGEIPAERQPAQVRLPEFLLSAVRPCEVQLVPDTSEQTQPSKTEAELLADGQCEV
jgi:hypothetical protein